MGNNYQIVRLALTIVKDYSYIVGHYFLFMVTIIYLIMYDRAQLLYLKSIIKDLKSLTVGV